MSDRTPLCTRRTALRGVAAGTAAGSAAVLAGCSSGDDAGSAAGSGSASSSSSSSSASTPSSSSSGTPSSSGSSSGSETGSDAAPGTTVPAADVPVGEAVVVQVLGDEVVLAQPVEGQFAAYSAVCPHQGGIVAVDDAGGTVVACPLHGSRFDTADGAAVLGGPADEPLSTFPITVEGDQLLLG